MFQRVGKVIRGGLVVAILGLGGCAEFGWNPLDPDYVPPEKQVDLPRPKTLAFDLGTLADVPATYKAEILSDPLRADRRKSWTGDVDRQPQASLVLRHSMTDKPLAFPQDPKDAVAYWPDMAWRSLDFQTLYETRNRLGPALWRRFVMGPFTCVMMNQTVGQTALAGYYCSPAAEELSDGQAETVVQSVRFEDGAPTTSQTDPG